MELGEPRQPSEPGINIYSAIFLSSLMSVAAFSNVRLALVSSSQVASPQPAAARVIIDCCDGG